jgi:hypothetical protein
MSKNDERQKQATDLEIAFPIRDKNPAVSCFFSRLFSEEPKSAFMWCRA